MSKASDQYKEVAHAAAWEEEDRREVEERKRQEIHNEQDNCIERNTKRDENAENLNFTVSHCNGMELELKDRVDVWRQGIIANE